MLNLIENHLNLFLISQHEQGLWAWRQLDSCSLVGVRLELLLLAELGAIVRSIVRELVAKCF